MKAFTQILDNLDNLPVAIRFLLELGDKHVHYKVGPEHFPCLRAAVLTAIKMHLGK